MSIEDRDWYREEYKKKRGRTGSSGWFKKENKPQKNSKTINEFLAGERKSDEKVRDAYYNPKEFRIDRVSSKRPWPGVNKRERIKTVKITPKISIVKASLICIFLMLLTFSATMLVFVAKPVLLNVPYQIALKTIEKARM